MNQTTYMVMGADHHEYGPATAEHVREWIQQGRADGDSLVQVEGTKQWKPLRSLPEFADLTRTISPPPPPSPPTQAVDGPRPHYLATPGFVMGVLACFFCGSSVFAILGLVLSGISFAGINDRPDLYCGAKLAVAGLALSILALVLHVSRYHAVLP